MVGSRLRKGKAPWQTILSVVLWACLLWPLLSRASSVPVRYREGVSHGFLIVRTLDGKAIAYGEASQLAKGKDGDRVTNTLRLRFNDGSFYEDNTVFLQNGTFRLISDHVLQKGPSFKPSMETWIDATTGKVTVRYVDSHGKEKQIQQTLKIPPDVANGLLFVELKDIQPSTPQTIVSYVATSPKPRLVHLQVTPQGVDVFSIAGHRDKAEHYLIKVQIGGVAGAIAPIIGTKPPDIQAWILSQGAPTFARMEGPLYESGPVWRMELAIPSKWLNPTPEGSQK